VTTTTDGTQPASVDVNAEGTQPASESDANAAGKSTDDAVAFAKRRWAKQRDRDVSKAEGKAISGLLGDLGFDDVDELREAIEGRRSATETTETLSGDLKKLQRQLAKVTGERDAHVTTLSDMKTRANAAMARDAVYAACKTHSAFEEETYALLQMQGKVGVDEDGEVYVKGSDGDPVHGVTIDTLVKQTVAERVNLQRASGGSGGGSQPTTTAQPNGQKEVDLRDPKNIGAAAYAQYLEKGG